WESGCTPADRDAPRRKPSKKSPRSLGAPSTQSSEPRAQAMPELPEVEVVRLGLVDHVVGRTIRDVRVLHDRAIRRHAGGADDFAARLRGRRVIGAHRRGKFLWMSLDDGSAVLSHLGM